MCFNWNWSWLDWNRQAGVDSTGPNRHGAYKEIDFLLKRRTQGEKTELNPDVKGWKMNGNKTLVNKKPELTY